MKTEEVERTELEFREGSSDKVYIAILLKDENEQYRVRLRYGKRYNVNIDAFKPKLNEDPVSYGEALGLYNQMIDKKRKKGYVNYIN